MMRHAFENHTPNPAGRRGKTAVIALVALVLIVAALAAAAWLTRRGNGSAGNGGESDRNAAPVTQPATAPATQPSTAPAKPVPRSYMDVVLATHPKFPSTQPLRIPLDLNQAARLVLDDPIHLDLIGHLWITRDDADATPAVLKRAGKEQTHVTRERVRFVHRWVGPKGEVELMLVCRKLDGAHEFVSLAGRQTLGADHDYDWSRAFSLGNTIVVPTAGGASILRPDRRPMELHQPLVAPDAPRDEQMKATPTQLLVDWRGGILAWIPWENGRPGSRGAARFVDDTWLALDASAGWPEKLIHLIPLRDGGVVQIILSDDGTAGLAVALLDPPQVDENRIVELVRQMSDRDPEVRLAAYRELTMFGQGSWPVLEKLHPDQPPEARLRIEQLLSAKLQPRLGGMTLLPGTIRVAARGAGAALLYADGGVEVPPSDPESAGPDVVAPAWIALVPGRALMLAPPGMVADLSPETGRIDIVRGEFIVSDETQGPRWWLANHFSEPLLKPGELEFRHIVGQDARGRWLFRRSSEADSPTLVLDPTLPDPTPRLPVWRFPVEQGTVGWTQDDWPAIKSGGAWVLGETDWRPLDEAKETFVTRLDEDVAALDADRTNDSGEAADTSATPTTAPVPTTAEFDPPVFTDTDGTRYYDGRQALRVVRPDGSQVSWPLPPQATGDGDVWILRAGDDRIFLFNQPGRVLRLKPTPGAAEPFELEATFTRRIPSSDHYARVWLDPAGRIIIADGSTLYILFPSGTIPPAIARKMPAAELREAEADE